MSQETTSIIFGSLTHGEPEPGQHWTGTEILARLNCKSWAHLRLDEGGWCRVIDDGDTGAMCFEEITGYVILPFSKRFANRLGMRCKPSASAKMRNASSAGAIGENKPT